MTELLPLRIILGCPFGVPKEFEPLLEEHHIQDLDTGYSYVHIPFHPSIPSPSPPISPPLKNPY